MSRYFFNLAGDPPVDDPQGTELGDLDAVHKHAIAVAHALMRRTKIFREHQAQWSVRVTDGDGREVIAVPFSEASAADVDEARVNGVAFAGQLGWKIQLHIGKQMVPTYQPVLEEELPDRLAVLLSRLQASEDRE
jgi:hypothetical protein